MFVEKFGNTNFTCAAFIKVANVSSFFVFSRDIQVPLSSNPLILFWCGVNLICTTFTTVPGFNAFFLGDDLAEVTEENVSALILYVPGTQLFSII